MFIKLPYSECRGSLEWLRDYVWRKYQGDLVPTRKSVISARSLEISFRKKKCRFTTIGAFVITCNCSMPVSSVTEVDGSAELISCRLFLPFFLYLILSFTDQDCFRLPQKGHFQTLWIFWKVLSANFKRDALVLPTRVSELYFRKHLCLSLQMVLCMKLGAMSWIKWGVKSKPLTPNPSVV